MYMDNNLKERFHCLYYLRGTKIWFELPNVSDIFWKGWVQVGTFIVFSFEGNP